MRNHLKQTVFGMVFLAFTAVFSAEASAQTPSPSPTPDIWGIDTDGDNDPFVPGCIRRFNSSSTCAGTPDFLSADYCDSDNRHIFEMYVESNSQPSASCQKAPPAVFVTAPRQDCDELCKADGAQHGVCRSTSAVGCDSAGANVGYCFCFNGSPVPTP